MIDGVVDIGEGVTLTPSTQADYDYVNANLREGDRCERDFFGCEDRLEDMDLSYTVRDGEDIIAFLALKPMGGETRLSKSRFFVYLTTSHVRSRRIKYVRTTKKLLRAFVEAVPAWITEFHALTMESYVGAVRWLERVVGMRRIGRIDIDGEPHVHFVILRDAIVKGGV